MYFALIIQYTVTELPFLYPDLISRIHFRTLYVSLKLAVTKTKSGLLRLNIYYRRKVFNVRSVARTLLTNVI